MLVFLPQILILFGFIAVLEDCGYMARAAFLMDKLMSRCGLSGKSFIPMLSSVACAVPGIMADARHREPPRPAGDDPGRPADELLGPAAGLHPADRRVPDRPGYPVVGAGPGDVRHVLLGLVVAPLVALLLKRTLLRGETPAFVMEMPLYKWPSLRTVLRRMFDSGWAFVCRAGTLILASMVLVWALLYFPRRRRSGTASYDDRMRPSWRSRVERTTATARKQDSKTETERRSRREWKRQSCLGRFGHRRSSRRCGRWAGTGGSAWRRWRASRPARWWSARSASSTSEGKVETDEDPAADDRAGTGRTLQQARRGTATGPQAVFTVPVALSLMVFFALCCQCASTLAVIRRETRSWGWPVFTFVYMTVLAYVGALVVYQVAACSSDAGRGTMDWQTAAVALLMAWAVAYLARSAWSRTNRLWRRLRLRQEIMPRAKGQAVWIPQEKLTIRRRDRDA